MSLVLAQEIRRFRTGDLATGWKFRDFYTGDLII